MTSNTNLVVVFNEQRALVEVRSDVMPQADYAVCAETIRRI